MSRDDRAVHADVGLDQEQEPEHRFTLANEPTVLAWLRMRRLAPSHLVAG